MIVKFDQFDFEQVKNYYFIIKIIKFNYYFNFVINFKRKYLNFEISLFMNYLIIKW